MGNFYTKSTGFYMIEPPWIQLITPLVNKIPWSQNNCDIYGGGEGFEAIYITISI
jgi:hypothetical protein